jgi:hypothetical protein
VWYFVVLCCVGGGPASIPALKVVAPFCLCFCCCLESGSFVYLGRNYDSVRFDPNWHPTRTFLPLNTSTSIRSCPKHRLDSGQRPIKNTFLPLLFFFPTHHITSGSTTKSNPIHHNLYTATPSGLIASYLSSRNSSRYPPLPQPCPHLFKAAQLYFAAACFSKLNGQALLKPAVSSKVCDPRTALS